MSDVLKKSGKQWRFSFKPTAFQVQMKQSFLFSRYLFLLSEKREAPDICWLPWHSNYSIHSDQNQLKSSNHLNCVWKYTDNQSQSPSPAIQRFQQAAQMKCDRSPEFAINHWNQIIRECAFAALRIHCFSLTQWLQNWISANHTHTQLSKHEPEGA